MGNFAGITLFKLNNLFDTWWYSTLLLIDIGSCFTSYKKFVCVLILLKICGKYLALGEV